MTDWNAQVCVVTGAGSGIGAALARYAVRAGMHVIAADIDEAGLASLRHSCGPGNAALKTTRVDVTDPAAVEALAESVFAAHGKVNLLFNNAGILVDGKSWTRKLQDWRWSFDVNVMGVIHGIHSFVPRMLEQGEAGRIVNTSSIGGLLGGGAFMGPYQASKHAVTALSETLFRELALESAPVTASVLCPAEVATGIWESDRLRTDNQSNTLESEEEQAFHNAVAGNVAAGVSADEFACKVFDAIALGTFWIFPDTGFLSLYEQRTASVVQQSDPSAIMITAGRST